MKILLSLSKVALVAAVFCFVLIPRTNAQSNPIDDASASFEEVNAQTYLFTGTFMIRLTDTLAIDKIEVKLGTYDNASDIRLRTFDFDITSGLPAGCSYSRSGNNVTLGIGNFSEKNTYFGEARIKDTSGNWSSPFKFISN